jgi:hypothetical protein
VTLPESGVLSSAELQARQSLDEQWQRVTAQHGDEISAQLTVHTDVAVTPVLEVHASLMRPSVLHAATLDYGLTQLHAPRTQYIVLHNPSDHPVQVQLLPLATSAAPWWSRVLDTLWPEAEFYYAPESVTRAVLAPHRQAKLGPLVYVPHHARLDSITVTVRNNLTVYEQITVQGQGGTGHLALLHADAALANTRPTAVVLHLQASDLARCVRGASGVNVTTTVLLTNDGSLPLKVDALGIDARTWYVQPARAHGTDMQQRRRGLQAAHLRAVLARAR